MKLLNMVNLVMPKLGERPVTSLEQRHPTLAILLPIIDQNRISALIKGWWFNEYTYTAMPDLNGIINIGSDTLSFVPLQSDEAVQRGTRLFNPVTLDYVFTQGVKGRVTQDVPFDDLPESAAQYVFYSALIEAYTTDIGVTQELQIWTARAQSAWSDLLAEHLRQKKYSTRRSPRWQRMLSAMQG